MAEIASILEFLLLPVLVTIRVASAGMAVLLAPVVAMVAAAAAAVVHVWLDIPIAMAWTALVLGAAAVVWLRRADRQQIIANASRPWTVGEVGVVSAVIVVAAIFAVATPEPQYWDARSIWLFHASWFIEPSSVWMDAQSLEPLRFSHPNYPPLGPGSIAVVWGIAGDGENLHLGARLLTVLGILGMGLVVLILHRSRIGRRAGGLVAPQWLLVGATVFTLAGGYLTDGYMDIIQATLIGAVTATLVTVVRWGRLRPALAGLLVAAVAASLAKQEGAWFCAAVILAYLVSAGRRAAMRHLWLLAVPLGTLAVWQLTIVARGDYNDSDSSGVVRRLPELLSADSVGWATIGTVIRTYAPQLGLFVALVLLTVLGLCLVRDAPSARRMALFLGLTVTLLLGIIILTFALGDQRTNVEWWTVQSMYRVTASAALAAWIGVAVMIGLVSDDARPRPRSHLAAQDSEVS